jgi:hypothetical protein
MRSPLSVAYLRRSCGHRDVGPGGYRFRDGRRRSPGASVRDLGDPLRRAYPEIVAQVDAAERGGLERRGIQDHPYQRRFLDTFALIADPRGNRMIRNPPSSGLGEDRPR